VHQETPVFLLKYCHNKDLNEIERRIQNKNPKSAFAEATADKSEARNPKFTRLRRARILMTKMLMTKTTLP
jgi:hypothetical protein